MRKTTKGVLIASAVASLFALSTANAADEKGGKESAKSVKCAGVNECKGKAACSSASNSCAGENGCKGKGWVKVGSEKECKDKGGTVVAAKK
jgi:hypothetical protein